MYLSVDSHWLSKGIVLSALGIHRKTKLRADMGELGRPSLGIDTVSRVLAYHEYIELKDEHSIKKYSLRLAR